MDPIIEAPGAHKLHYAWAIINTLRFYVSVCVCVCVSDGSGMFVGAGLDYSDARPSYFNLFTEPRTPRRMFENIAILGPGWNPVCNRGAAVEADAIGRAAVQADAIGE